MFHNAMSAIGCPPPDHEWLEMVDIRRSNSGTDPVASWIPAFAGMTRVVVFSHPPLEGEVSRAERGTAGVAWREGDTPPSALRAATSSYRGGCGLVGRRVVA